MTHSSAVELEEQVFDLRKETDCYYGGEYNHRVSITCLDDQPSKGYKLITHIDNGAKLKSNPKFKIILKSSDLKPTANAENNTVKVDSCFLVSGKYKVYTLNVFYKKVQHTLVPVVIGIIIESNDKTTEKSKENKFYYKYRDFSKNNNEINLYGLTKLCKEKIEVKHLENEYEALNITLTFNIQTQKAISNNCLTKRTKEEEIEIIESNVILATFPSYVVYSYRFKSGFNKLKIEGDYKNGCIFNGYKESDYNNANLDRISFYFLKCDAGRKVPLLVQFTPRSGYQFFPNGKNCISVHYALVDIKGQRGEKYDYLDGRTFNIESFINYNKYYEQTEISVFEHNGPKLKNICERKNVKKNMEIILGLPPTPEEKGSSAGIAFGIIFFLCVPIGVLTYFHYNRLRASLYDFYYKHRTMHLRGFE